MTSYLYVFPHPDDESFGPGAAIARQRAQGDAVTLLTWTRGGATKRRHDLGLSVEEMGRVRSAEMRRMAEVYDLTRLEIADFPDGDLASLDPLELEASLAAEIARTAPDVLVSYPVHGVSGFADHLVAHAIAKRVFCDLRRRDVRPRPRRLAFTALLEVPPGDRPVTLTASSPQAIDCVVEVGDAELDIQRRALACYETYRETIAAIDPMAITGRRIAFEIWGERHDPPLADLGERLPE